MFSGVSFLQAQKNPGPARNLDVAWGRGFSLSQGILEPYFVQEPDAGPHQQAPEDKEENNHQDLFCAHALSPYLVLANDRIPDHHNPVGVVTKERTTELPLAVISDAPGPGAGNEVEGGWAV